MATSVLLVDSSEDDIGTLEVENDAAEVKVSVIVPEETPLVPKKNQTNDESESDEETDSSDEDVVVPKKNQKDDESESDEDTDSSDEDVVVPKKKQKDDESESDEGTDSSDEDVPAPAIKEATIAVAKEEKEASDDSEDESFEESNEEEPKQKKMNVQQTDVEMVDSQPTPNKEPTTLVTPKVQTSGGSKTVFIGNVPFSVENTDMENFFKEVGGVIDVRFAMHTDGSKKGFGHVEFVSADAAKKAVEEMNGKELMGHGLRLSLAMERVVYTPHIGDKWNSFQESEEGQRQSSDEEVPEQKKMKVQQNDVNMVDSEPTPRMKPATPVPPKVQTSEGSKTVFVGNIPNSVGKADMEFFFKDVGEVVDVRFAIDSRGKKRDFGHVEFASAEAAKKAVEEMNGKEMMGRVLRLDLAKEREVHAPQRGDERNSFPKSEGGQGQTSDEEVQTSEGSKIVFVGNLPYSVEKADMKNFFKEVGEVVDVRLSMHPDGSKKGFGHIEFASADAAKKAVEEMNGKKMMGRGLRLGLAKEKEVHAPQRGVGRNSSQKSEGGQGRSSDEEEPKSNNMKFQLKDVGMVDSELTPRKNPATPVPPKVQTCEGSKTVFVGNLPYSVEKTDMEFFFKDVGEVVDVRFPVWGKKRDFAHVVFASAEAAKKAVEEMNGKELMGRGLRLSLTMEREVYTPQIGDKRNSFPKSVGGQGQSSDEEVANQKKMKVQQNDVKLVDSEPTPRKKPTTPVTPKVQTFEGSKTVFVGNLPYSVEKADMKNFFKEVGEVVAVRLSIHPDGSMKGFGHIEFASADAAKKAVEEMNGKEMMGRGLRLGLAKEREVHAPQSGDKRNSFPKSEGGQGQSSDEEVPKQKKMKVEQNDVKMVDSEPTPRKKLTTPVTPKVQPSEGSKTVFVGNLPYSVEEADMKNFFKEVGEVVGVRLSIHPDGSKKGFGHIEFASADAAKKAVEKMNGKEMMGRLLRLDLAKGREEMNGKEMMGRGLRHDLPKEREEYTLQSGDKRNSFPKSEGGQGQSSDEEVQTSEGSKTVFVGNLPYSVEEADMNFFFKEVGEVVGVRLSIHPDGLKKGFGHIEFASADAAKKAVEKMNGKEMMGRLLRLDLAKEREEMNGKEMMGRGLRLDLPKEREEYTSQSGDKRNSFLKSEGGQGQSSDEEVQTSEGSKTVFVGNLPYSVEKADMKNFFKEVGEVVDVRLSMHPDGSKKGFGHIEFASADAAKKAVEEMNGKEMMGRGLRLGLAKEREEYTPQRGDKRNSFPKNEGGQGQSSDEEVPKQKKMKVQIQQNDVKLVNSEPTPKKQLATSVTPNVQTFGGLKTVFIGNLPFSVEKADMENFFKEVGEVVDVRFAMHTDGSKKGFGHVVFASADAAKKAVEKMDGEEMMGRRLRLDWAREREEMNGKEMMGRGVRLDLAREREEYTSQSGVERNSFQKSGGGQALTIFIRGLDINDDAFKIKEGLKEHFGSCGEITRVYVATDPEGCVKGTAHMDFIDNDAFNKALELDQSEFGKSLLLVEVARPKIDNNAGGGRRGTRR